MMNRPDIDMDAKFLEFIKLLNIYLNHFPRHEKYALSSIMRNTAYEIYNLMTECRKRYFKKTTLTLLDVKHEQMRMQIRLAWKLGYFQFKDGKTNAKNPKETEEHRILAITKLNDEIGRMIGGWMKRTNES